MAFSSFSIALASPEATASTRSPESATPGGTGSLWRAASPSPTAFEPYSELSRAFAKGTTFFTSPKHRHFACVPIDADTNAIRDPFGGLTSSDHAGDAVFARDDCRM